MAQYYSDLARLPANENIIINGNFDFWQRGTSFNLSSTAAYTADRWFCDSGSVGASGTFERRTFSVGQSNVPGEPEYNIRYTSTTVADDCAFIYPIEDVRRIADRTMTLSFYCFGSTAMTGANVRMYNIYDDDPSEYVFISDNFNVGTSWGKKVITFTMPSLSGKSLGANTATRVYIRFNPVAGETASLAQVKLEEGAVATPFVKRQIAEELMLCQRYYYNCNNDDLNKVSFDGATSGQSYYGDAIYPVKMAVQPTITVTAVSESGAGFNGIGTSDIIVDNISTIGFRNRCTATATDAGNNSYGFSYTADGEIS